MAYTVTISYAGITRDFDNDFLPICRTYVRSNSYVDSTAFEGTCYDTNVEGTGLSPLVEPYASTSIPFPTAMAQFKLAGTGNKVQFETDDYKEAFYYVSLAKPLESQGFSVTVKDGAKQLFPVVSLAVVDNTAGTAVTAPTTSQTLFAKITLGGYTDIAASPIDAKAHYAWKKADGSSLGTAPTLTMTSALASAEITCVVSYDGYEGQATWKGTVAAS